jgi:hypothetical protein
MTWGHKDFVKPQLMSPNYFLKSPIEKLVILLIAVETL